MKFKIGDRVRITSQGGGKCTRHHFGIGEVVEIKEGPDCVGDYWCKNERGMRQDVNHSCFELVKESKLKESKLKVGDKVIGNEKAGERYSITTEGWIGTVVEVRENGKIDVEGKGLSKSEVVFDRLEDACFDLYEEKKEKGWRIEIVPNGEETTATLYKRGKAVKSATVKRYKGDEYSIADAADYAVQKLFEKNKKKEFKIGARVVGVGSWCGKDIDGKIGTIREISGGSMGVEFDEFIYGHSIGGKAKPGYGWYCIKEKLKLI